MEAKDTVMNREQLKKLYAVWVNLAIQGTPNFIDYSQHHQAKISFKAGIKEVVEWIEMNDRHLPQWGSYMWIANSQFSDKLKEWEIV